MQPKRIQLSRKRGWRKPPGAIVVARPTRWGNPFRVGMYRRYTAENAVEDYLRWIERDLTMRSFENLYGKPPTHDEIKAALRGHDLCCWCDLDQPWCHADVLLQIANG
jgi:hypothetical protein